MRLNPKRGEIWRVDLEPTRGAEMQKTRPCIVISSDGIGRLPLRLIVPVTGWNETYINLSWMVRLDTTAGTGLTKTSAADIYQIRGVALERFESRLGTLALDSLSEIAKAIALTVEFTP